MSVIDDIAFLREDLLRPLVENESKDVIVLTYSYGGVPTSVVRLMDLAKKNEVQ